VASEPESFRFNPRRWPPASTFLARHPAGLDAAVRRAYAAKTPEIERFKVFAGAKLRSFLRHLINTCPRTPWTAIWRAFTGVAIKGPA